MSLKPQGVRYVSDGKFYNISSDQVYDIMEAMHSAICRYLCATGKKATHLVLGKLELVLWRGMIALHNAERLTVFDATGIKTETEFKGCVILKSAEDSRLEAVELEKA